MVQARVRTQLTLREAREQLAEEKRKVDRLLDNILPPPAVAEIKKTGGVVPRRFENVAVLFSDLVGFTNYCDQHAPEEVVSELGDLFVAFENCARLHGLEKIKDDWRCISRDSRVAGASRRSSCDAAVSCALAISEAAARSGRGWQVRSGVHIGPVMAGIVGHERYQFDIWGDTVNVASRLTGAASPGAVALTEQTSARLPRLCGLPRGAVELKGKGSVQIVEVTAIRRGCTGMNDRTNHGEFGVLPIRQVAALFLLAVCVVTGVASGQDGRHGLGQGARRPSGGSSQSTREPPVADPVPTSHKP